MGIMENSIKQIFGYDGYLLIGKWYGFKNPNLCLINYFDANQGFNVNIDILPLRFWEHIEFSKDSRGAKTRYFIGIGIASCFFDLDSLENKN